MSDNILAEAELLVDLAEEERLRREKEEQEAEEAAILAGAATASKAEETPASEETSDAYEEDLKTLRVRQEIQRLENLEKAEKPEKPKDRGPSLPTPTAKGIRDIVGVKMSKDERSDLYFGRPKAKLWGGKPTAMGTVSTDSMGRSLQPLRDAGRPQMSRAGSTHMPGMTPAGAVHASPLRPTPALGGARPGTGLEGLEHLRRPLDLSRLRGVQGVPTAQPQVQPERVPMLMQKAQAVPRMPLESGETAVESYPDPVYFWIGPKQRWEKGVDVWITQMVHGVYRFVGRGEKTGRRRSKTIGKDVDNAAEVAVKGPKPGEM